MNSRDDVISLGDLDATTREGHGYSRPAPNLFYFQSERDDLRRYILRIMSEGEIPCPPEGCWLIKDCYLVNGKHVLLRDGRLVEQTVVDQNIEHLQPIKGDLVGAGELREMAGNDDPIVSIMKAGSANYGHVLVEMLPRLVNVKKLGFRRINLVLPEDAQWARPMLDLASIVLDLQLNYLPCGPLTHVDELTLMSAVSKHNSRKSLTVLDLVDAMVRHVGVNNKSKDGRVAIWRRPSEKRAVGGDKALLAALQKANYQIIYPAELSFVDQIHTFASASKIIAPLGAGLTNLVFAPSSCSTFMLDPGLFDFFFWDLAGLKSQQFNWYFNRPLDYFDFSMLDSGFKIDSAVVETCLRRAGFL